MIYISAQPDDPYFQWQLELQLQNFKSLGILKDDVHVLVGFNPLAGLQRGFQQFIDKYSAYANFFVYPDTRKDPCYSSSIRPHLLEKHWNQFPKLEKQTFFYHDSDIILTRRLRVKDVLSGETNYVSDTRSYLSVDYICSHSNRKVLQRMAHIVGVSTETVEESDNDAGGAQYILKNIPKEFWFKVYGDCERMYKLLRHINLREEEKAVLNPHYHPNQIQAWCTDMWVVLWNLWYYRRKVRILPELNFSWPTDPIGQWSKNTIHHYSGQHSDNKRFFYKRDYIYFAPWYDEGLRSIPANNCSFPLVGLITKHKEGLNKNRIDLHKITIRTSNDIAYHYFQKCFTTSVSTTDAEGIFLIPGNLIISPLNMASIDKQLENAYVTNVRFLNVYRVDQIFTEIYSKFLDFELLAANKGKFSRIEPVNTVITKPVKGRRNVLKIKEDVFVLMEQGTEETGLYETGTVSSISVTD